MEGEFKAQINMVDGLIKKVKGVQIPEPSSAKAARGEPDPNKDICWLPFLPPGHTAYSWMGEEDEEEEPAPQAPASKKKQKQKQKAEKKKGGNKQQKNQTKKKGGAAASDVPLFARVDLRVGHVVKVFEHPNPEVKALWCEEIDVGEDQPRLIASGLRKFYTKEQFQGKKIVVVCNLKPAKLVGFVSHGMVLCASNEDHTKVELVEPPANAKPGTRICLKNLDVNQHKPDEKINPKKKNSCWNQFGPKMRTNASKTACFDGVEMVVPEGDCVVPTLADCVVR